MLLQEGAKVNIIDCYGNNPLWYAVFNANDDYCLVKLLVKYGADALSKNNAMRSPLDFAKQIEDTEMINILAKKKRGSLLGCEPRWVRKSRFLVLGRTYLITFSAFTVPSAY